MNRSAKCFLRFACLTATSFAAAGDNAAPLAEPLKPFAPFLGKTWRGEFVNAKKPTVDIARWERALNGQAIRTLHSINDGAYGGESIIMWDAKKKSLVYWYFTTAGFRTEGTMKHEDGQWIAHETVAGGAGGVTEVKSISKILPDGRMHVKAEYLKDGQWTVGRETYYKEAPEAKVIFK